MSAPKPTPAIQGGFEDQLLADQHTDPASLRAAAIDVLDTAERVVRWLVDHGIKPEPMAVAQLTGLIVNRVPPDAGNRPLVSVEEGGNRPRLPAEPDR